MALAGVLDANVVLYLLGGRLALPLPSGEYGVSVITEMELLAWPNLTEGEEEQVRSFLNRVILCELTSGIRETAVKLRRRDRLKLPDAVIAATAMEHAVPLWTNDSRLHQISGLSWASVVLQN